MCAFRSSRERGSFAAKARTLFCRVASSCISGLPGGRQALKRPSAVATAYAGYSRALTRCSVPRMRVAFHDFALVDRVCQPLTIELCEPAPERDIRCRRPLALEASETLDRLDHTEPPALEQHLPCEQRAIQLTQGEQRSADRHGAPRLGEASNDADHLPLDLDVARVDRGHRSVRGLQANAVLLFVEALEGGHVVLEQGHDDVDVTRIH